MKLIPFLLFCFTLSTFGATDTDLDRFRKIFAPLNTDCCSISPDGGKIAYTIFDERGISIYVKDLNKGSNGRSPGILLKTVEATRSSRQAGDVPVIIRWIGWPTNEQLVVSIGHLIHKSYPEIVKASAFLTPFTRIPRSAVTWADLQQALHSGEICAFDLTSNASKTLAKYDDKKIYASFSKIYDHILFEQYPKHLVVRAKLPSWGRSEKSKVRNYSIELSDGKIRKFDHEINESISRKNERSHLVAQLEGRFPALYPGKEAEVVALDQGLQRALVLTQSVTDCGEFNVLDMGTNESREAIKRAAPTSESPIFTTSRFDFSYTQGQHLTGWIVLPHKSRTERAPIVFLDLDQPRNLPYPLPNLDSITTFPGAVSAPEIEDTPRDRSRKRIDRPFMPDVNVYRPEVIALASMGFAVVQLSPFSSPSSDPINTRLSEVDFVIKQLVQKYPVSHRRVALLGSKLGAALALECLQRRADRFRCAVAIDTLAKPGASGRFIYAKFNLHTTHPLVPALLFALPQPTANPEGALNSPVLPELIVPTLNLTASLPENRAIAFQLIEDFLNAHLYRYRVDAGETKVVDE